MNIVKNNLEGESSKKVTFLELKKMFDDDSVKRFHSLIQLNVH